MSFGGHAAPHFGVWCCMDGVNQLSDDESWNGRCARDVAALSDEEPPPPPAPVSAPSRKRKGLKAQDCHEIRHRITNRVQRRCSCSAGTCLQQFSNDCDALVQLQCEIRSLDKRDADMKAFWFLKLWMSCFRCNSCWLWVASVLRERWVFFQSSLIPRRVNQMYE